jgi:pyridoxamine 5'-phosphate oxidase
MNNFFEQLKNDHHQFDKGKLEDHLPLKPHDLIAAWLREALERNVHEPSAITLSSIGLDGFPQARIVYLREFLEEGFVFYTNYNSAKGKAFETNPKAGILFFWPELERQIRISGTISKVPEEMSDTYFSSRPYGSKIGAWASKQSEQLQSREELENEVKIFTTKFPSEVPRPPHWGGYLLSPIKVEFWQGRPSRLHDRIVYEEREGDWKIHRLNP